MKLSIPIKAELHNRFDIFVKNVKTGEEKQVAYAENIILNTIWGWMFTTSFQAFFATISVGRGTGSLSASRTTLFNKILHKAASGLTLTINYDEGYVSLRKYMTLLTTDAVGETITEVGIGVSGGNIATHALLKDMNGNTVSITKTNLDEITVYATFYLIIPEQPWHTKAFGIMKNAFLSSNTFSLFRFLTGHQVSSSSNTDLKLYLYECCGVCNPLTGTKNKYGFFVTTSSMIRSEPEHYYGYSIRIQPTEANFTTGIKSLAIGQGFAINLLDHASFSGSPIVGEQIGVGDGVTKDFKTKWGLVKSGATVYVDGIEQVSGVTVDTGKPTTEDIGGYFIFIENTHTTMYIGSNDGTGVTNAHLIFENPLYQNYGIGSLYMGSNSYLAVSNDLSSWTLAVTAGASAGVKTVPSEYQKYRYWKLYVLGTSSTSRNYDYKSAELAGDLSCNVHFDTAPAEGEIVTIDYTTPIAAKDSDHVIDLEVKLIFNEYVEEY